MSNVMPENVLTRQHAKELARKYFWKLLVMLLIMAAIVYALFLGGALLMSFAASALTSSPSMGAASISPAAGIVMIIGYFALMFISTLLGGGMTLGLTCVMIDLGRGDDAFSIRDIFSRMNQCLKQFGLSIWIGLKTAAWMLPGYAVSISAIILGAGSNDESLAILLALCGVVLIFALCIPAAYRYMLAPFVLADKPSTSISECVSECVSESKRLMKGHKWQAFKLPIPILLAMYGLILAVSLVFSLAATILTEVSAILAAVVSILFMIALVGLMLFFVIRTMLVYSIFYLNRANDSEAP